MCLLSSVLLSIDPLLYVSFLVHLLFLISSQYYVLRESLQQVVNAHAAPVLQEKNSWRQARAVLIVLLVNSVLWRPTRSVKNVRKGSFNRKREHHIVFHVCRVNFKCWEGKVHVMCVQPIRKVQTRIQQIVTHVNLVKNLLQEVQNVFHVQLVKQERERTVLV